MLLLAMSLNDEQNGKKTAQSARDKNTFFCWSFGTEVLTTLENQCFIRFKRNLSFYVCFVVGAHSKKKIIQILSDLCAYSATLDP